MVRIPINVFKTSALKQRYDYAVFKVAKHEDSILEILTEKKYSIQALLYVTQNMNISDELSVHLDSMQAMLDHALETANESSLKDRAIRQEDCELELIEKYNNGYIDIPRLQKLHKLIKDACTELLREHTFKVEAIQQSESLKKVLDSIEEHRQNGRGRAMYNAKKEPHFRDTNICGRFFNCLEYTCRVHLSPLVYIFLSAIFCLLTISVLFFETSLYLSWD